MRTAKTDQTERMPRLIPVFLGPKVIVFVLSCCGSHDKVLLQKLRVLVEEKNLKEACNCHNGKFRNTMYIIQKLSSSKLYI